MNDPTERIRELEKEIAKLKGQFPKHSIPPAMLERLDELEEELARERKK
jgi:hypothetical protein